MNRVVTPVVHVDEDHDQDPEVLEDVETRLILLEEDRDLGREIDVIDVEIHPNALEEFLLLLADLVPLSKNEKAEKNLLNVLHLVECRLILL